MNETVCRNETLVMRAAAENRWTDALRAHAATCPDCAAAASVAPFMTEFAERNVRTRALPDSRVIWVKAQLFGGSSAADRATRPISIAQIGSYIAVAAAWAALMMWKWPSIQSWFDGAVTGHPTAVPLAPLLVIAVGLVSTTLMLAMHTILAEE